MLNAWKQAYYSILFTYEKLVGDKAGTSSVRVNDQYRVEFEEYTEGDETLATILNITDLSNHYK